MDGASRFRILLGTVAIGVAVLASLALLNVLFEEPLPLGEGDGDDGGEPGGSGNPFQPPDDGTGQGDGGASDGSRNKNPCDVTEPAAQGAAIGFTILSMLLWVIAVWWRQRKATRVMNAWAIIAVVVTLVAVTALFAWWIVHKVCSLDVFDLKSCLEIAHSLRNAFILFLLPSVGLIAYALLRKKRGQPFWGLWSGAGLVFAYLAVLALAGWLVAEDLCEKQFKEPDIEPPDGGDPGDPDGGPDDPDDPDGGQDPGSGGQPGGGGSPGGGGRSGGGNGGGAAPAIPQVSPFVLLVILGLAAVIVVVVLAFKGRQEKMRAIAAGQMDLSGGGGLLQLFTDTDIQSNDRVVAAYRRFLDHCRIYGVPKRHEETPREHARRAADALDLDFEAMKELVDAYALIRLGARDATPEQREEAIRISRSLRPTAVRARKVRKGGDA